MKFRNLTPHTIVVREHDEAASFAFPPDPQGPARVSVSTETLAPLGAFRLQRQVFGQVENLPEPQEGTTLIVSAMVLSRCAGRTDVVAPDTGRDAVRDDAGRIVAARGFVSAP